MLFLASAAGPVGARWGLAEAWATQGERGARVRGCTRSMSKGRKAMGALPGGGQGLHTPGICAPVLVSRCWRHAWLMWPSRDRHASFLPGILYCPIPGSLHCPFPGILFCPFPGSLECPFPYPLPRGMAEDRLGGACARAHANFLRLLLP